MRKSHLDFDYSQGTPARKPDESLCQQYAELLRLREEIRLLADSRNNTEHRRH